MADDKFATIAIAADLDDPDDFDVSADALDAALAERRSRLRRSSAFEKIKAGFDDAIAYVYGDKTRGRSAR